MAFGLEIFDWIITSLPYSEWCHFEGYAELGFLFLLILLLAVLDFVAGIVYFVLCRKIIAPALIAKGFRALIKLYKKDYGLQ